MTRTLVREQLELLWVGWWEMSGTAMAATWTYLTCSKKKTLMRHEWRNWHMDDPKLDRTRLKWVYGRRERKMEGWKERLKAATDHQTQLMDDGSRWE